MSVIQFIDVDGMERDYPQSFSVEQTRQMYDFVLSEREHTTMIEAVTSPETDGMKTVVRHDVDHSIDYALKMARFENSIGVRSSYFILHTAWYFQRDFEETMSKCREMQRLGHEVGIHHDAVSAAKRWGGNGMPGMLAKTILQSSLMRMHGAEVHVRGAAAHGGECNNLAMWDVFSLSEFGLAYEAYRFSGEVHANYISDNRGELRSPLEHIDGKPAHLLVHCEHWQIPR